MMDNAFIEVFCQQKNHEFERICGDVFLSKRIKEENRIIIVLSDGMGSGVKANILATLTATMAVNFTEEHKNAQRIAEIIMKTLPVCSERQISYSTFTILDIEQEGLVTIIEYDNPQTIIIRNNAIYRPQWNCMLLEGSENKGKEIKTCQFKPLKGDRYIVCTDGVAQSGLGSEKFPFGWGNEQMEAFLMEVVSQTPDLSADKLAERVVNRAYVNDGYHAKDDISCASIYFREPRKLLICTGPPFEESKDALLANKVKSFNGTKIVCGATTSDIISREWQTEIQDSFDFDDPELPPISYMEGLDLITEGILTLTKVADILKNYENSQMLGKGPADLIVKHILSSDSIEFIVGTKINIAHQDPNLPVELEIRRTVIKRLSNILEEKFLKEVKTEYI